MRRLPRWIFNGPVSVLAVVARWGSQVAVALAIASAGPGCNRDRIKRLGPRLDLSWDGRSWAILSETASAGGQDSPPLGGTVLVGGVAAVNTSDGRFVIGRSDEAGFFIVPAGAASPDEVWKSPSEGEWRAECGRRGIVARDLHAPGP